MPACLKFTLYPDNSFPTNWWRNDVQDLSRICQEFAGEHFSIDIIHVAQERQRAFLDGVVSTPTVFVELGSGRKQNLGNISEARKYMERVHGPATNVPAKSAASIAGLLLRFTRAA